ncbi:lantibiotic dehydratase C-terminal domain-containing protein [Streptomyces physcomitrii]|uniref:Lantibiotic biosynthesis protein n=1 Tax=Streptomyces physcomitrii TaxID=2724184 RepID=A0ABX1H7G1_9ACTN|nr:lantibiotic dehydratase C-terminal domain-containing protein [Streptomyces physcomitrii]NKI44293.1 lantibiotic biosynthesis protein [Streptomyces physcomitrii]
MPEPTPLAAEGVEPGPWQAMHIFYAANPQPLLVTCVRPLITALTEEGLIDGHFFINYWLEGPHVRLRLRPARPALTEEVRRRAEEAVSAFLRTRPALYQVDSGFLNEFYNALFEIEFPEGDRSAFMGPDGRMNLRPNNSYTWEAYEPEYGKYGGPAGIELAEWHFAHSSDLVMEGLRSMNLHLRTVLLGSSAQLMMVMAAAFLPDRESLADFFDRYYEFWNRAFPGTNFIGSEEYDRQYAAAAPGVAKRFAAVRETMASGELGKLPAFLRGWAEHCIELRTRAAELARQKKLVFRFPNTPQDQVFEDPAAALPLLLFPYMHMTNNRLHVTVRDEAYLSQLLGRVLREQEPSATAVAP